MECDICEEKPAKFLCKTCSGHLCEKCKSEHAKTKMFKKHEVVPWKSNEDLVSILHCTDHTKKKLECFCDRCEKPVCTECMLFFHNGHCMKSLSDGYREIKDKTLKQKEKIENEILPKYTEVLAKESNKRSALTKRSAEIEQTIHTHTKNLIEMIKKVSAQTVQNLKEEEKKGLQEISSFQESVSKKINALEQKRKTLYAEVRGNPEVLFFSSRRKDELDHYQVLPVPPASHYILDDFRPGNLSFRAIEDGFGIVQKLKRSDGNGQSKSLRHQQFSEPSKLENTKQILNDKQSEQTLEQKGDTPYYEATEKSSDFIPSTIEESQHMPERLSCIEDAGSRKMYKSMKCAEYKQTLLDGYKSLFKAFKHPFLKVSDNSVDELVLGG